MGGRGDWLAAMPRIEISSVCDARIAPGRHCGHHIEDHLVHGVALLECWRCEDWHYFEPRDGHPDDDERYAA